MEAVHSLPEEKLWKVIEVIFGDTDDINAPGKEFEVNFATLDDASCLNLARYIDFPLMSPAVAPAPPPIAPPAPSPHPIPSQHQDVAKQPRSQQQAPAEATSEAGTTGSRKTQPAKAKSIVPKKPPAAATVGASPSAVASGLTNKRGAGAKPGAAKRHRSELGSKATSTGTGRLSPRISIRKKQGSPFRSASLLEKKGTYALLLYDKDLSLEWVDLEAKGVTCISLESIVPEPEGKEARMERLVLPNECQELLDLILKLDPAVPFREPVDPKSDAATEAMDLSTVGERLAAGQYSGPRQFVADIMLVFQSALAFNPPTHSIYKTAQVLVSVFQSHWASLLERVEHTLKERSLEATVSSWCDQHQKHEGPAKGAVASFGNKQKKGRKRDNKKKMSAWGTDSESSSEEETEEEIKNIDFQTFAQRGNALIGQSIQISWDGPDGPWQKGAVTEFDNKSKQHMVQYADGTLEKLSLDKEMVKLEPKEVTGTCLTLRTGQMVWAKANKHPWWPAEVVLPGVSQLVSILPPPASKQPFRSFPNIMVLYSGESQYDLLKPSSIERFSFSNPAKVKARIKKAAELAGAFKSFLNRCKELDIDTGTEF